MICCPARVVVVERRGAQEGLDAEKPFLTRFEYLEALAAISRLYWPEVQRKVTGARMKCTYVVSGLSFNSLTHRNKGQRVLVRS